MEPAQTVKLAVDSDLSFLVSLQRTWANNVGFLPKAALLRYVNLNQCLVVFKNGQHAGYVNWCARKDGLLTIPQVAIEPTLLRTTLGTKIVRTLKRAAKRGNCSHLRLRSRSDLPCNKFWPEHGFIPTTVIVRPTARGLPLIEWTCSLLEPAYIAHILATGGKPFRITNKNLIPTPTFEAHDVP